MGLKGSTRPAKGTASTDEASTVITIWKLDREPVKKTKSKTKVKKLGELRWECIYSDNDPIPDADKLLKPADMRFSTSRELLEKALAQESVVDDEENDGADGENPFEGFTRSAQPTYPDIAVRVKHTSSKKDGGKTWEALHHIPYALLDECKLISVGTKAGDGKAENWRFFEYNHWSMKPLKALSAKQAQAILSLQKNPSGKDDPKVAVQRQFLADLVQSVSSGVGRIIVTRQAKPKTAKKSDKGTADKGKGKKVTRVKAQPVHFQVFGRMRMQLVEDKKIYCFGRYDIDGYDFGALDFVDSDAYKDTLRKEIRDFHKKARLHSARWSAENERNAIRFAIEARKALEATLPDHKSFASVVKEKSDEKLRNRIAAEAKAQTFLRDAKGDLSFVTDKDQIVKWKEHFKKASPEELKEIEKALAKVTPKEWKRLGIPSPQEWDESQKRVFDALARLGVPSPEAGIYTPFHVVAYIGSVMSGETLAGDVIADGGADGLGSLAGVAGGASSSLEVISCWVEMSYIGYAIAEKRDLIDKIDTAIAKQPPPDARIKKELETERERLKDEIADLKAEAVVVLAKSSVALLSAVKSINDIVMSITQPSVDLAKDGFSVVLGSIAGAIGTIISAYVAVTQTNAAIRTQRRLESVSKIKKEHKRMDTGDPEFDPVLLQYMRYGSHKLKRKRGLHIGRIGSASLGVVGGAGGTTATILTAVGVVGATNAWNPIGWTIAGAGLAVGIGLSVYMIHRRVKKKKLQKKREATGKPVDKEQFISHLVAAYVDEDFYNANPHHWRQVSSVLKKLNALKFDTDEASIVDFKGAHLLVNETIAEGVKKL